MASKNFKDVQIVKVTFDTSTTDSAGVANTTVAAHPSGVFIPNDAIIREAFYEVETTFISAGADAGTIAIMVNGANDVVTAIAISAGTNPWDGNGTIAGVHSTKVGQWASAAGNALNALEISALIAASFIKTTATREVTFTVGGQVLSAGKLHLYLIYTVGI